MPIKVIKTRLGRNVTKRGFRYRRVPRGKIASKHNVHYFKRTFAFDDVTGSNTDQYKAFSFGLSDLPDNDEFTKLFDQYKISAVKIKVMPVFNSVEPHVASTTDQTLSKPIISVIDYTDDNLITQESQLLQYSTMKMTKGWKEHVRFLKPRCSIYVKEATNASARPIRSWLSSEFPDVKHYGVKMLFPSTGTMEGQSGITYRIYMTYYIACKNVL